MPMRNFIHTKVCDLLGIEYPIMNAGMGSVAGPELVAAVCNAGGLGSLGTGREGPDEMRAAIKKIRSLTDKPFAVQLAARSFHDTSAPLPPPQAPPAAHVAFVKDLKKRYNIPDPKHLPPVEPRELTRDRSNKILEVVFQERVPILVTSYGNPTPLVREAHKHGMKVLSLVGKTKHARYCVEAGSDVLIATGWEAGGHSGQVAAMALVPQVVDVAKGTPVMAAGSIMDGRGFLAALSLGASGVVLGTAFLLCHEAGPFADSDMPPLARDEALAPWHVSNFRKQLIDATEDQTVQSREYSGGPLRKLRTAWTDEWAKRTAPEPLLAGGQTPLIRELLRGAYEAKKSELLPNLVGQGVGMLHEMRPARDVIQGMVQQAVELAEKMYIEE